MTFFPGDERRFLSLVELPRRPDLYTQKNMNYKVLSDDIKAVTGDVNFQEYTVVSCIVRIYK